MEQAISENSSRLTRTRHMRHPGTSLLRLRCRARPVNEKAECYRMPSHRRARPWPWRLDVSPHSCSPIACMLWRRLSMAPAGKGGCSMATLWDDLLLRLNVSDNGVYPNRPGPPSESPDIIPYGV